MLKMPFKVLAALAALSMLAATSCSKKQGNAAVRKSAAQEIKIAFVPKIMGDGYFEAAGRAALQMGEELGITVTYDGPKESNVSRQIEYIHRFTNQGYDAIVLSALSPTALNKALQSAQDAGAKVLTWDSDVESAGRSFYISQGTAEQLGRLLVEMTANQMPDAKSGAKQVAFLYSSPEVTDQNAWAEVAKAIIAEEYPNWEVVATQYGYQDPQRSMWAATDILSSFRDLDALICPDSAALPAAAQGAEALGRMGRVIITGFSTPNVMRPYVESGTVDRFALWNVELQAKLAVYMAYQLALGAAYNVGDKIEVPGIGIVEISPNDTDEYSHNVENNGVILLPERAVFTKDNINNYDF